MVIKARAKTIDSSFASVAGSGLLLLFFAWLVVSDSASGSPTPGDDAPSWLRQLANLSVPDPGRKVPAVVLLSEQNVKVDDDSRVMTTERGAVRIFAVDGREAARASVTYLTDTGKVREMRAWLIRPNGQVRKYDKDDILDLAASPNDIFYEVRRKIITGSDDVEPGSIFGYEWITEDRSVFTQFEWQFQEGFPTLLSRYSISLPTGWRADGITFNAPKIEPTISGSTYSWELRNLDGIEDEPASPSVNTLAPRLAVSYFPAPGKTSIGRSFEKWSDVSRWLSQLSDPQAVSNDALVAKSKELISGAKTEFERIQAIGRYAQNVNYISIQTGIGRGGGYRPHSAIDVFTKSYGDCKDKANLMRTMLKSIGIESYLVSIWSGDRTYVREEWPSPQQFNHCIIAVKVSAETQARTIVTHPALGRLLVFDPTDDNVPVGDLPGHEQGSLALIVAGDNGMLLRMPVTPPEANKLERVANVELLEDGSIKAQVREHSTGQSAVAERRSFRGLSRPDYLKAIERWVTRGASGASVTKVEPIDHSSDGKFSLNVEFAAARYGQLMQGKLLIFKPAIVERQDSLILTEPARRYPVVLQPRSYAETVKVKLPLGFHVDEMPDAVKLETPFGIYATNYEVKDGHLNFSRSLLLNGTTIPVADYSKVRSFFASIRAAEQAPVVLQKK
jgi:hypothetical protein